MVKGILVALAILIFVTVLLVGVFFLMHYASRDENLSHQISDEKGTG